MEHQELSGGDIVHNTSITFAEAIKHRAGNVLVRDGTVSSAGHWRAVKLVSFVDSFLYRLTVRRPAIEKWGAMVEGRWGGGEVGE